MKKLNFLKVLTIIFSTIFILTFNSQVTFAETKNIDLVTIVDKYVVVEQNNFILKNEDLLKQDLKQNKKNIKNFNKDTSIELVITSLKERLNMLNMEAEQHKITIQNNKRIVNNLPEFRAAGHHTSSYWWGVKHTFYYDDAARDYAYGLRMAAHANAETSVIASVVFGGVGALPNGLSVVYGYMVADSVDYNANKAGNGVILDVNWWLIFSCYPR